MAARLLLAAFLAAGQGTPADPAPDASRALLDARAMVVEGRPGVWVTDAVMADLLLKAGRLRNATSRIADLERLVQVRAEELDLARGDAAAERAVGTGLRAQLGASEDARRAAEARAGAWWRAPAFLVVLGAAAGGSLAVWALR